MSELDGQVSTAARERPEDVAAVLTDLAGLLVDEETLDDSLNRIVRLAVRTIPGCDAAGVTLVRGERPRTAAYTDERTLEVDRDQYDIGEGPCLDAIRRRRINRVDVEEAEQRWARFTKLAKEVGLCSYLAAPLVVGDDAIGALNLYSRQLDGFDELDEAFVAIFTAQAAVAVTNHERYTGARQLAEQMQQALQSRAAIDQAKGVLMARQGVDADGAFELLRQQSQQRNVKLRDVAQEILASTRSLSA